MHFSLLIKTHFHFFYTINCSGSLTDQQILPVVLPSDPKRRVAIVWSQMGLCNKCHNCIIHAMAHCSAHADTHYDPDHEEHSGNGSCTQANSNGADVVSILCSGGGSSLN